MRSCGSSWGGSVAEWQRVVRDLEADGVLLVQDGNHGEYRPRPAEFGDTGTAFIRAADMRGGRLLFESAQKINEIARERVRKGIGAPCDVVLSHKGTVGKVAFAPAASPPFVCSPQTTFWRSLNHEVIDPQYLYAFLRSEPFKAQLRARENESDMAAYVSLTEQRRLSVTVPPLAIQRAISDVLGVLDEKITVNERIAGRALELADAQFASSAQGLDFGPDTFGSTATVVGGGTPSTKTEEYWGGGIAWTTPTDVTALSAPYLFETGRTVTGEGLENCASRLYPAQSIFMTSRATIGAFALPQMPAAVNQGFIVVLPPTEELRWWLLHEMRSRVEEMISLANGSTFLELSRKNFKAMTIRLASERNSAEFARAVAPLHRRAAQATAESRTLAALRDTLLPQLMAGKLRVRDAEKIVEDAV